MYLFTGLKDKLSTYFSPEEVAQISDCYIFARDAHQGQNRASGDPYITHPIAVAHILADMHMDKETIMAALMHDVVEDCDVSRQDIESRFGNTVADLVEGVTKLTQIKFRSKQEAQAENFQKMVMAMTKDIRVILIKLADRLHNMRTLGSLRPDKKRRIANETLEIYARIANRLGISSIRDELEDLGFAGRYPMRYRILRDAVKKARGNRKEIVSNINSTISSKLESQNVNAIVLGREKVLYSIYKKMREKTGTFSEVMDVYGFRVVTDTIDSCYRILGIVHNLFKPVPGRFKDYIAIPKANGYQSLHTTLKGPHGLHVEVQIRTKEMDEMANQGVAAHWIYKTLDSSTTNEAEKQAREWMQRLLELKKNTTDSMDFIENVKFDLFPDDVYIFTPNGNILSLPQGSTPIDFAYAIHTDVGNACIGCKIDKKLSPLSERLSNGQTVEVITAPGARPNPAWLSFVTTGKARVNIRHFLKKLRRDEAINLGRRLLEKELENHSLDQIEPKNIQKAIKRTKHNDLDDLLADIGLGSAAAAVIAHHMEERHQSVDNKTPVGPTKPLAIKGTDGALVNYAVCCYPLPGDHVLGFVSSGAGITIHRDNCEVVGHLRNQSDKLVTVNWEDDIEGEFRALIKINVFNSRGVLASISREIADNNVNIFNMDIDEQDGTINILKFVVGVNDRIHLARLIKRIRKFKFVNKITRI
jgi:GTP diphosphokinase / guanosine-3',5'-bis(diphosphate) 3'-diphosphatase